MQELGLAPLLDPDGGAWIHSKLTDRPSTRAPDVRPDRQMGGRGAVAAAIMRSRGPRRRGSSGPERRAQSRTHRSSEKSAVPPRQHPVLAAIRPPLQPQPPESAGRGVWKLTLSPSISPQRVTLFTSFAYEVGRCGTCPFYFTTIPKQTFVLIFHVHVISFHLVKGWKRPPVQPFPQLPKTCINISS